MGVISVAWFLDEEEDICAAETARKGRSADDGLAREEKNC